MFVNCPQLIRIYNIPLSQASIALATSLVLHPLASVDQPSSLPYALSMPYDKKKGKLAQLPPSPAYKTVLALRALRAASASSMDISPPAQRRTPAGPRSRPPAVGGLPAAPPGQVILPRSNAHLAPPPSHTGALQDQQPRAVLRKPLPQSFIPSTNHIPRLAAQELRATAHRHQVPREVLEISDSSTMDSSASSTSYSSYLSIPPSGPSWDEPMTEPSPPPPERCFFDDVLEDHVRAHERYIRKGGRVNPRSLYATLPTNVADLAAHLGLATSHVRSDASSKPSSSQGFGGHARSSDRASSSSKVKGSSACIPETVDRFANHGPTRAFAGAKAAPLGISRRSNEQQVDDVLPTQVTASAVVGTGAYATPRKQRPRQTDRHQGGSAQPVRTPSSASPAHPMRLRSRQADHRNHLQSLYDIVGSAPREYATAWDPPTPERASPSPYGHQAGGPAAGQRPSQFLPPPGPVTRNEPAHPDPRCGLVINDVFADPPCPDVLQEDSHEVLRQIQDFLNSQMQRAQAMPFAPAGLPAYRGHPWAR